MKTVKEFKDAGLVFVDGDSAADVDDGDVYCEKINKGFVRSINSRCNYDCDTAKSFAWRTNTGVKPEFVGVIDVKVNNGNIKTYHTDYFTGWHLTHDRSSNGGLFCWLSWRPHLPSMPTETKEEKEALDKIKSPYDGLSCGTFVADAVKRISTPKYDKEFKQRGGASIPEVWVQCAVLYRGGKYTILKGKNGKEYSRKSAQLNIRPFVSERDQAVESLREVILEQQVYGDADGYLKLSTALHDAGYRLQSTENTAI